MGRKSRRKSGVVEEAYEVEKIISHRYDKNNEKEFEIKWKNYGPEDNTWEVEGNLACEEILSEYWQTSEAEKIEKRHNLEIEKRHKKKRIPSSSSDEHDEHEEPQNTSSVSRKPSRVRISSSSSDGGEEPQEPAVERTVHRSSRAERTEKIRNRNQSNTSTPQPEPQPKLTLRFNRNLVPDREEGLPRRQQDKSPQRNESPEHDDLPQQGDSPKQYDSPQRNESPEQDDILQQGDSPERNESPQQDDALQQEDLPQQNESSSESEEVLEPAGFPRVIKNEEPEIEEPSVPEESDADENVNPNPADALVRNANQRGVERALADDLRSEQEHNPNKSQLELGRQIEFVVTMGEQEGLPITLLKYENYNVLEWVATSFVERVDPQAIIKFYERVMTRQGLPRDDPILPPDLQDQNLDEHNQRPPPRLAHVSQKPLTEVNHPR